MVVSGSGHARKATRSCEAAIHVQDSTHKVRKSASQVVLGRMQLTLRATRRTPRGTLRLVHAMPAWSVKTRRAPSRHCRDARVNGHKTTAMHEMSTRPFRSLGLLTTASGPAGPLDLSPGVLSPLRDSPRPRLAPAVVASPGPTASLVATVHSVRQRPR